jgi:hypothetical protein
MQGMPRVIRLMEQKHAIHLGITHIPVHIIQIKENIKCNSKQPQTIQNEPVLYYIWVRILNFGMFTVQ